MGKTHYWGTTGFPELKLFLFHTDSQPQVNLKNKKKARKDSRKASIQGSLKCVLTNSTFIVSFPCGEKKNKHYGHILKITENEKLL